MTLSVACIGLGRMGSGIAANIQKAGFPLMVYNRTAEKTKPFVDAGAKDGRESARSRRRGRYRGHQSDGRCFGSRDDGRGSGHPRRNAPWRDPRRHHHDFSAT